MGNWGSNLVASLETALVTRAIYRSITDEPFTAGVRARWSMDFVTAVDPPRPVARQAMIEIPDPDTLKPTDLVVRLVV